MTDLRDTITRIINLDHLQLLHDFDVDPDIYRMDPECFTGAVATADAILATLPQPSITPDMVKPLVWDDFEGRGAKAKAWGSANYLITMWSTGKFQLAESYPGHQGNIIGDYFYNTLEAAKAAAQAHHAAMICAAINP